MKKNRLIHIKCGGKYDKLCPSVYLVADFLFVGS